MIQEVTESYKRMATAVLKSTTAFYYNEKWQELFYSSMFIRDLIRTHELTSNQINVLLVLIDKILLEGPKVTLEDLSETCQISIQSVQRSINVLVSKELLYKQVPKSMDRTTNYWLGKNLIRVLTEAY